jgi:hypothetical protein
MGSLQQTEAVPSTKPFSSKEACGSPTLMTAPNAWTGRIRDSDDAPLTPDKAIF